MNARPENPTADASPRVELAPLKWVQKGCTLAHDPRDGLPVFLQGALPGERALARILKSTREHHFASAEQILAAAPGRIVSDCEIFPRCGGCSFRHITYADELKLKAQLLDEFEAIARCRAQLDFRLHSAAPVGYRNHIQLQGDGVQSGFFAPHSHDLLPLPGEGCRNVSPAMNARLLAGPAERGPRRFRETAYGVFCQGEAELVRETITLSDGRTLDWDFPFDGFFQTNRFLLPTWLDRIETLIPEGDPDTAELFCGAGLIGGAVRSRLGEYSGYESAENSLAAARANFDRMNISGAFHCVDLYRRPLAPPANAHLILLNPPRAGLGKSGVLKLIESRAEWLLYSSCNPATLNRDLYALLDAGFEADACEAFDFFPRTPHLEILVRLRRVAPARPRESPRQRKRRRNRSHESG